MCYWNLTILIQAEGKQNGVSHPEKGDEHVGLRPDSKDESKEGAKPSIENCWTDLSQCTSHSF